MKYRLLALADRLTGHHLYPICYWVWENEMMRLVGDHLLEDEETSAMVTRMEQEADAEVQPVNR